MQLKQITLRNFRNYTHETVLFVPGVNLIYGENGAGKTSLLEALYLLSTGRSFRTPYLKHLIRKGSSYFYVQAQFEKDGIHYALSIGFDGKNRKIQCNSKPLNQLARLIGILTIVVYTSFDSQLIEGSPAQRRRFLNIQLSQSDSLYVHHLLRYHKAMKNRNALLKAKTESGMNSYEQMMVDSATYLTRKRSHLISALTPIAQQFAKMLSDAGEELDLFYSPSITMKCLESTALIYLKHRKKELFLGNTLYGPHRDDFLITYRGKEAKFYASEGQKRACVAALKMAERKKLSEHALLGIDDFGAQLDEKRTEQIYRLVVTLPQVFLIASSHISLKQLLYHRFFYIKNGKVAFE